MDDKLIFLEKKKQVLCYLDSVIKIIDEIREKLIQITFIDEYKKLCSTKDSVNLSIDDKISLSQFKLFSNANKNKPIKELNLLHKQLCKSNKNKILSILDLSKNIEIVNENDEIKINKIIKEIETFTKTIISLEILIISIVDSTKERITINVFQIDDIKKISWKLLLKLENKKEKLLSVQNFVENINENTLSNEWVSDFFDYIIDGWKFNDEFIKKYNIEEIILEEKIEKNEIIVLDKSKKIISIKKEDIKSDNWFLSSFYHTFIYWINKPWWISWVKSKNRTNNK